MPSPQKTVPYLLQNIFVQNTTEKTSTEEEWTIRPTSELRELNCTNTNSNICCFVFLYINVFPALTETSFRGVKELKHYPLFSRTLLPLPRVPSTQDTNGQSLKTCPLINNVSQNINIYILVKSSKQYGTDNNLEVIVASLFIANMSRFNS